MKRTLRQKILGVVGIALISSVGASLAQPYSIPPEKLDPKRVYWGSSKSFEKAGEIDYKQVISETPEYSEIEKKKIERGTGKYWILLSQASDRVVRSISEVGQQTDYDLIASRGYLASIDPGIPAEDITKVLLDNLHGRASTAKRKR